MELNHLDIYNGVHLISGGTYRHFKGKLYTVLQVAQHTENNEELVIYYQHENQQVYARPLSMFCSEVDRERYPEVTQKYRFELLNVEHLAKQDKDKFIWRVGKNIEESAYIEFRDPAIVFLEDGNIESKTEKDILYYYYDVEVGILTEVGSNKENMGYEILSKKNFSTHDFPKVLSLPHAIDEIVSVDIKKEEYLISTKAQFGMTNLHYRNTVEVADMFDIEYYIKIEKNVYVQVSESEETLTTTGYRVTIGSTEIIYQGAIADELSFNYVSKGELLELKEVAERFVQHSVALSKKEYLEVGEDVDE